MVTKNQVFVAVLLFFTFVQASESKEICTTYDANDFKVIASEEDQPFEIPLYKSEDNKEIKLLHEDREFFICNETKKIKVNAHRIDKDIRSVNTAYLKKMLQKGYLVVSQSEEGEYKIDINARLKGGGAGGAAFGFFLGQVLVWGACHTVAGVAGAFGTPLAGVAAETAISASSPFIAAIALKVSLGLGVFFGAATGPI